jgi:broad specificity phosphatase PhoE
MTTRLYLLRHGATDAATGTLVGSTDLPLSGQGLDRLTGVSEQLLGVDCWYCSPMLRTLHTVDILTENGCNTENIIHDPRLREIDFGDWELKTFSEISRADPDAVSAWSRYADFIFPGGEAVQDFRQRIEEMLSLFTTAGSDRIAVITHGGVIRTMICLTLGIPVQNYLLFDVQPASLTVLEIYSSGGILKGLNL